MKLVDRTLTTINDGSLKIEEAIGQAANEIASEVSALPLKVEALLKEMGQSFQAIANQLAEIPSLINPVPIVAPLPEQMANSSLRLRDILAQAAQIPVNLVSLAGNTQGVTAQVGASDASLGRVAIAIDQLGTRCANTTQTIERLGEQSPCHN